MKKSRADGAKPIITHNSTTHRVSYALQGLWEWCIQGRGEKRRGKVLLLNHVGIAPSAVRQTVKLSAVSSHLAVTLGEGNRLVLLFFNEEHEHLGPLRTVLSDRM